MPKKHPLLTEQQSQELQRAIAESEKADEIKRAQAILLIVETADPLIIKTLTGYRRSQAFALRQKYLTQGITAIVDKRKGEPKELLTKTQRDEIVAVLKNTSPQAHGYTHEFWTSGMLADHIERQYGVKYKSKTSFYIIFRKASFSFHKPGKVYEKHDPVKAAEWRKQTKPLLTKAFRDPDTIILAEDEMILSTQTTFQKVWLPINCQPKVEVSNTRKNRSVYGFLNLKTGREHAFKTEKQNMFVTVEILKKLRRLYPTQKILLLWDGAGWHRGSAVQEFIKTDGRIETHYFPPYSPEENPQEHVWKAGRSQITHNKFIADIDAATDEFVGYLNSNRFEYSVLDFSPGS